jgi:hypothetical protein
MDLLFLLYCDPRKAPVCSTARAGGESSVSASQNWQYWGRDWLRRLGLLVTNEHNSTWFNNTKCCKVRKYTLIILEKYSNI